MQTPSTGAGRTDVPAGDATDSAVAEGADRLTVLATSDNTVYVFSDRGLAAVQYQVCIGANLDVEVFRVAPRRWAEAERQLRADDPQIVVVDTRADADGSAGEPG